MNNELKDVKAQIRSYFGDVKNQVHVFCYHRHRIVAVEYEDFLPQEEVEQSVRAIAGSGYLVTVKRECSERMQMAVVIQMLRQLNGEARSGVMQSEFPAFEERMDKFNCITA